MHRTLKFRLYPNKEQEEKLLETLGICRYVYNFLLREIKNQKIMDRALIQGLLPDMKICEPKLNKVYSKVLQTECYKLFSNFKGLVKNKQNKRKNGKLKFKNKYIFRSFTYNQSGFKLIETEKRCQLLHLSKIGNIQIRCHRNIKGKIKQITIKKYPSGKWFANIVEENNETIIKRKIKSVVGIDLGLINMVYDSEGNKITNPKYFNKYYKKLSRLHRKLSRTKIASKNRLKERIKVARQYEKLVNSRNDFLHKLSRYYVDNYDAIGFEDLIINGMVHNKYLSKSILNASWGKLRQFVAYKAESAGKLFVTVNFRGTTQRCSNCRKIVKKKLSERLHKCPYCNLKIPRDYNSALEIKNLMLKKLEIGQGLSDFKPVEKGVRLLIKDVSFSRNQETYLNK